MRHEIRMLNVAMAIRLKIDIKLLNNRVRPPFCFWFADNADIPAPPLLRTTHLTAADILTMNQFSCMEIEFFDDLNKELFNAP